MEIILSSNCKSFTGSLGSGFGYSIQRRKNRFFAKRNSKGIIPPDGHWNFIVSCAQIAKMGLHFSDIRVSKDEVKEALYEAHHFTAWRCVHLNIYNARDILNLKTTFGL